jgi:two-component sensor histidine kinase
MQDHTLADTLWSDGFMPHGMCLLWRPDLLLLHAGSDALIALSYYSIPAVLTYFVVKRRDLVFPRLFLLFATFVLACGTTHVLDIWILWHPAPWLDGGIKLFTAAVSLLAAATLWRALPMALALPGRAQLEDANAALAAQVEERRRAAAAALAAGEELEARVRERTAELEAANGRLRAALHEKEVLLREVHHRVKNNLQVVSGLLTLQARHAAPGLKEHFRESLERIQAMGRVHEQLYLSEDASAFDLGAYVERMTPDIARAYAGPEAEVASRVEVRGRTRVPLDAATPLALIANEVLANAFKHAFPPGRAGEVAVSVERVAAGVRMEIRDDGVGLPEDHADRAGQSMGLKLVDLLARQIGGVVRLEGDAGGTRFTLTVPDRFDGQGVGAAAVVA